MTTCRGLESSARGGSTTRRTPRDHRVQARVPGCPQPRRWATFSSTARRPQLSNVGLTPSGRGWFPARTAHSRRGARSTPTWSGTCRTWRRGRRRPSLPRRGALTGRPPTCPGHRGEVGDGRRLPGAMFDRSHIHVGVDRAPRRDGCRVGNHPRQTAVRRRLDTAGAGSSTTTWPAARLGHRVLEPWTPDWSRGVVVLSTPPQRGTRAPPAGSHRRRHYWSRPSPSW